MDAKLVAPIIGDDSIGFGPGTIDGCPPMAGEFNPFNRPGCAGPGAAIEPAPPAIKAKPDGCCAGAADDCGGTEAARALLINPKPDEG